MLQNNCLSLEEEEEEEVPLLWTRLGTTLMRVGTTLMEGAGARGGARPRGRNSPTTRPPLSLNAPPDAQGRGESKNVKIDGGI